MPEKYPHDNITLLCQQTTPNYEDWVVRLVDTRTKVTHSAVRKQVANINLEEHAIGLTLIFTLY